MQTLTNNNCGVNLVERLVFSITLVLMGKDRNDVIIFTSTVVANLYDDKG